MIGPFSFFGRTGSGASCSEHIFYYLVPTDFGVVADVEVKGQRQGKVTGLQLVEVRAPSKLNEFRDPDGDVVFDREFNLPPGTYVRFAYRPDDAEASLHRSTTETVTVTLDDGWGAVTTSSPQTIQLPALGVRRRIAWGPRSTSVIPSGSIDVTRLHAFAGSTYLPTGQVVFDVFASERDVDDDRITIIQPAHGTVVALAPHERTPSEAGPDEPDRRFVFTPDDASRVDPWVHADEFSIRLDDGRGDIATTVPVVIAKRATVIGTEGLPYLGVESFSGRISAPIGDVEGYVMVPSVFLAESIESVVHYGSTSNRTAYGSVVVRADGSFTYTRDPRWELLPVDELDDSFTLIAYGADNQWAAVVVPVGGAALASYPSILDVLNGIRSRRGTPHTNRYVP